MISAPGHRRSRDAIRAGWSRYAHGKREMDVVFFIGRSDAHDDEVREEADTHKDVVVMAIKDSYENLSLKTISALQWAEK